MEMQYTKLGDSGLLVSRLALGTMTFNLGSDFIPGIARVDQAGATEMVAAVLDAGVNFFDTANGYSSGDSETALGVALKGRRREAVICTKLGFRQGPGVPEAGLSRRHIYHEVEGSLSRLGTDYLDLLVVHKTDFTTPLEETLSALDDMVKAGKVRYLGVSNWPAWQVARAVEIQRARGYSRFITGQYLYNALNRDIEQDVLPMSAALGIGLMAWSPLSGGLLSGKYKLDGDLSEGRLGKFDFLPRAAAKELLAALGDAAKAHEASVAEVALAWILAMDRSHTVLVGANKMSHLSSALASAKIQLSADEVEAINKAAPPPRRYPQWMDTEMTDQVQLKALS